MKVLPLKIFYAYGSFQNFRICVPCANEYAKKEKEKEKNATVFTKNYGEVLVTMSDYLLYTMYTCIISGQRLFYIVRQFLQ